MSSEEFKAIKEELVKKENTIKEMNAKILKLNEAILNKEIDSIKLDIDKESKVLKNQINLLKWI